MLSRGNDESGQQRSGRPIGDHRVLSRCESYGVAQPVQHRETHAAIVFLAGSFAYKLKRAAIAEPLTNRSGGVSDAGIAVARQQRSYVTRPSGRPVPDVTDVSADDCAVAAARTLNLPR